MAIVLVNPDTSVNYVGEELTASISTVGVIVVDLPDKTAAEVYTGNIPQEFCVWDAANEIIVDSRSLATVSERRATAKKAIDTAAGNTRARYVSAGHLVEEEYRLVLQQTQAWRIADSPADQVPLSIQAWADAADMTAEAAATDIEQTASAWETVLITARQLRLAGKASVDASGDDADFDLVAKVYIDQLDAL